MYGQQPQFNRTSPSQQKFEFLRMKMTQTSIYLKREEVLNACGILLNNYPSLNADVTPHPEDNVMKTMVVLSGTIPVTHQGAKFDCTIKIVFPSRFPDLAPMVFFVNMDPTRYKVNSNYKQYATPDDRQITLFFSEAMNWNHHRDLMRLMKQIEFEFGKVYPIYDSQAAKSVTGYPSTGSTNSSFGVSGNPPSYFGGGQQQVTSPVGSGMQNIPSAFGMGGMNGMGGAGPSGNIPSTFNQGMTGAGNIPSNFGGPSGSGNVFQMRQDCSQRVSLEIRSTGTLLSQHIDKQKKETAKLFAHASELETVLTSTKESMRTLDLASTEIDQDVKIMQTDVLKKDKLTLTPENVDEIIDEGAANSKFLVDIIAENKAIYDLMYFIENAFKNDSISFESLMKYVREFSTKEFYNRELARKIISGRK